MSDQHESTPGGLAKAVRWFSRLFVDETPEELTRCQFRCHKTECRHDDWENCPTRLSELPQTEP